MGHFLNTVALLTDPSFLFALCHAAKYMVVDGKESITLVIIIAVSIVTTRVLKGHHVKQNVF